MLLSWAKFSFLASEDRRELWFPVPCNQDRKLFLSGHEPWELCPHFRSERVLRKLILPLKRDNLDLTSSINEFLEELTLCWYICGCFLLYLAVYFNSVPALVPTCPLWYLIGRTIERQWVSPSTFKSFNNF